MKQTLRNLLELPFPYLCVICAKISKLAKKNAHEKSHSHTGRSGTYRAV